MKVNKRNEEATEYLPWYLLVLDVYLEMRSEDETLELTKALARVICRLEPSKAMRIIANVLGDRPLSHVLESRKGLPWTEFDKWIARAPKGLARDN